jgi:diguanylate cyclase (GGDEF)-like protein
MGMWQDDEKFIKKDNAFHRRMADVRNLSGRNINEAEALDLIQNPNRPNPFATNTVVQETLTEDEVDRRAFFDVDTPTFNFRFMLRSLRRELTRARRYKRPLSVCVVVIDGYKGIFHSYGALAIESATALASESLIRCCRADVDLVGRYGEDRYLLILPETPGTGAAVLGERIREKFASLQINSQWNKIPMSVSIGISQYPGGDSLEELIAQAELFAELVQEERGGNGVFVDTDLA